MVRLLFLELKPFASRGTRFFSGKKVLVQFGWSVFRRFVGREPNAHLWLALLFHKNGF